MPPDFTAPALALMGVGALIMGFSKTSVGGLGSLTVAIFALGMSARESTATVLLLAIVGDIVAVSLMGKHCNWRLLLHLVPSVIPGLLLGWAFLYWVDDVTLRRAIGGLLVVSLLLQWWLRRRGDPPPPEKPHWGAAMAAGTSAGFTTMTANAAAPVMALYLMQMGVDKKRFIGTNAWFFAAINLTKVPFAASIGLMPVRNLILVAWLAPVVLLGTWVGRRFVNRLNQDQFDRFTVLASLVAAVSLLVR